MDFDPRTFWFVGAVFLILGIATFVGALLTRQTSLGLNAAVVNQFNSRIRAWWLLCAVLAIAFWLGQMVTVFLFFLLSFWALREFITLTPTRSADHRALFWVFTAFTPLQYVFVGLGYFEAYSVMIPVYGFLFIPARIALAGDYKRYLERCAKIQAGLMICVYCLSHAPALLTTDLKRLEGNSTAVHVASESVDGTSPSVASMILPKQPGPRFRLLFFFVVVVTMSDAFQFAFERFVGRRVIAPNISASKTWEGFFGGVGLATLVGTSLYWATDLHPWEAAITSLVISVTGFAGGMTMSAIKRDRGVKDYGTLVEGHGGVLDRIDSLCFAAPVFFHFVRLLMNSEAGAL